MTGIGERLVKGRRAAWERWYGPVAQARWSSAFWHALAWAIFGAGFVAAVTFVALGIHGIARQGAARACGRVAAVGVHRRHGR